MLRDRPDESVSLRMVRSAVECEKEFVSETLTASSTGINCQPVCRYNGSVADRFLALLTCPKACNPEPPPSGRNLLLRGKAVFSPKDDLSDTGGLD